MFFTKSFKFLIIGFTLSLAHQPMAKASVMTKKQRFFVSALVGAMHGLVNKMHFKAIKENPEKYTFFYFFTYVLAHALQRNLIGERSGASTNGCYTYNDFMTLFSHGLVQSLVESYDIEKDRLTDLSLNWTLVESFFAA